MRISRKTNKYPEPHKHERFLIFLCFLSAAFAGYALTNFVGLLGA